MNEVSTAVSDAGKTGKLINLAVYEAEQWKSVVEQWHGVFPSLYQLVQGLLQAVAEGKRKETVDITGSLFTMLNDLHVIFAGPVLGCPNDVKELERTVLQISQEKEKAVVIARDFAEAQKRAVTTLQAQVQLKARFEKEANQKQLEVENLQKALAEKEKLLGEKDQELSRTKSREDALQTQLKKFPQSAECLTQAMQTCSQIQEAWKELAQLHDRFNQQLSGVKPAMTADSIVPDPPQKEVVPVPSSLHATLEAWLTWDGQMGDNIRILSEHIENMEEALEEIEARQMAGIAKNGELSTDQPQIAKDLLTGRQLLANLVGQRTKGGETLRRLQRLAEALVTVQEGLPSDILQEPGEVLDVARLISSTDTDGQENTTDTLASIPINSQHRTDVLNDLAEKYRISPRSLLFITLYDLLKDDEGKYAKRGKFGVLFCAEQSGLLDILGCEDVNAFFNEWNYKEDETITSRYLHYCGTVGGKAIFKRTDVQLPWNSSAILSPEQMQKFLKRIALKPNKEK